MAKLFNTVKSNIEPVVYDLINCRFFIMKKEKENYHERNGIY